MSMRILPPLFLAPMILALAAAGAADAQFGGGMSGGGSMGGGGMGGHRGARQQPQQEEPEIPPPPDPDAGKSHMGALDKVMITGVITRIDPSSGQVTISYDAVDALNWAPGTTPFQVEKPELLAGLSVGEKVRFHLESQQISEIGPAPVAPPPDEQ